MPRPPIITNELITLTFGDMAENHVGMQQIGQMVPVGQGFHLEDLEYVKRIMEARGTLCEIISLGQGAETAELGAHLLVIRGGVTALVGDQLALFKEQTGLAYDKQAFMYGRVVQKHARWNLCFDERGQEPDYESGKGRIVGYDEVPLMTSLKAHIEELFGPKASGLKVESNYYYDTTKCGIGFHGDSERRKVVGVRIGYSSMPMHYQWFHQGEAVGERITVPLNAGDMYIMSEKAVGTDWKKKTIYTLRHATGAAKFTA
jgi:hypothetical protein